ncbi:dodecin domain-containing protein [Antarcticibacterium flavum]|jgi:dodecin|uniref:Dodecin domain-containing protein n=1 Tax=Antarcticibacterium flavum TaxID=2058175 RepID=A0A5B7X490_9FLAO|nr:MULTISPECIES: dodecin family protein [Antarcticibacterium]MCM4158378.1 dodecin domain-containing protein [Antarcticibacterium sp. W02-3]QCY70139.1 dodecin domain-containing protein [Antarcticibacterium flavum]
MALIKVVEIMANSGKSWEDAAQNAVKQAAKTIKNIKSIYVKEQTAVVNGENITEYRVNLKISFEVVH